MRNIIIVSFFVIFSALTAEPSNVKLHLRRCQLLKETGDNRAALRGYQKVHQSKYPVHLQLSTVFFGL